MSAASRLVGFSREGGRLLVRGTLGINENDAFYPEIVGLLESGHKELILDLTGVDYMSSICIGSIAILLTRAKEADTAVTVVAHSRIAHFLDTAGISLIGNVQVAED